MIKKIGLAFSLLLLLIQPAFADWNKPKGLDEYALQITSVGNLDGTISLYFIEPDREVAYITQTAPNSSDWTKRRGLDIYANSIKLVTRLDGRHEMFIIGTLGNVVSHTVQTEAGGSDWSKEKDLGIYASQLKTAMHPDGKMLLFFLDMGKEIGYMKQDEVESTSWGKPKMLDINGNSFTLGQHADGRIEIVNIGTIANVLYHVTETKAGSGEFAKEREIEDQYATQISLVDNADGTLALYYLNMDREIAYMNMTSNGWSRAQKTDVYANAMSVFLDGDGLLNVINIGTFGNVISHMRQIKVGSNDWTKEKDLKAYGKSIHTATNLNGKRDIFMIGMLANEIGILRQK